MIGLDTNFVVRLVVEDDAAQLAEVKRIIREAESDGETCLLTDAVLCELGWVLESVYGATRQDILAAIQALLSTSTFTFENRKRVQRALTAYESGRGDLADYLIGHTGLDLGARTTFTFDRGLRSAETFTVVR